MNNFVVSKSASLRIDEIYQYTLKQWGQAQANNYINGLFQHFHKIASGSALQLPVSAEFEVEGMVSKYQKHFVYSKELSTGN